MVQEDQQRILKKRIEKENESPKRRTILDKQEWPLAAPLDRVAATVVDIFVVLSPVVALFISPFKRELMTSVLLENQFKFGTSITALLVVALVLTFTYLTLSIRLFGSTLGMRFMNIKIVKIWGHSSPDLYHSALRTIVWMLNFLMLGLPNIAMFSNRHRRSLQDRISDTIVVTISKQGVGKPSPFEHSVSRGVFIGVVAFTLPLFYVKIIELKDMAINEFYTMEQEDISSKQCEKVDAVVVDWSGEDSVKSDRRLNAAMVLYAAGVLDEECIGIESDALFRENVESPLSYFAKAFVYLDNPEVSNDYLKIVCEKWPKSNACTMSQLVEVWSREDQSGAQELLASISAKGNDYSNVWATRHLLMNGKFKQAEQHLSRIRPNRSLATFIAFNKVKILWGVKKLEEARSVASVSYSTLSLEERFSISGWLCHQEMALGCQAKAISSCRLMEQTSSGGDLLEISSADTLLAFIEHRSCTQNKEIDFMDLAKRVDDAVLRKYLATLEYIRGRERIEQFEVLSVIISDLEFDSPLRFDAQKRLVLISGSLQEVQSVLDDWNEDQGGQEWQNLGAVLFSKLNQLEQYKSSYLVGEKLIELNNKGDSFLRGVVLASFYSGHQDQAWSTYEKYFLNSAGDKIIGREIASSDNFRVVESKLRKRYLNK